METEQGEVKPFHEFLTDSMAGQQVDQESNDSNMELATGRTTDVSGIRHRE